nr:MAG: hypothetical protein 3 [Leviviridae sp.]
MKIPTMLLERVLFDMGFLLVDTVDRDYKEICSRFKDEGWSFLTITLPRLDDALTKGLSVGRLTRSDFEGFRAFKRGGSLPALLQGFFRRIFDDDGCVKGCPDVRAIQAIRQVSRLFKKVEKDCSAPRIKAAYERYKSNDAGVDWRCHKRPFDRSLFATISGYLWADLEGFSGELYCSPGTFGTGATAERFRRNQRLSVTEWPERCEGTFPLSFHALSREDSERREDVQILRRDEERPVRVVQVPKTLKTPRTISVEPSYMMLMQQSVAHKIMGYLESKRFGFQSIRFSDQQVNKRLARLGSMDGRLATIDLKDASDLVSNDLVCEIFRGPCPSFLEFLQDSRSTRAQMPDGTIIPLRKFASMGSALCFPVEAMVFFTIIMYALVKNSGVVPSRHLLVKLARDVAVYGDDIIVPSSMGPVVMEALEDFGLKVNHDKSFLTGLFRESCGGDYYAGVDVTPVYVRHWDDTGTLSDCSHKAAYVSLSNQFYMKGMWHACQYLREHIDRVLGPLPYARRPLGVLHHASFVRDTHLRWDRHVHGYRVKGISLRTKRWDDTPGSLDGHMLLSFGKSEFRTSLLYQETGRVKSAFDHLCSERVGSNSNHPVWRAQSELSNREDDYSSNSGMGNGIIPGSIPSLVGRSIRSERVQTLFGSYATFAREGFKVDLLRHLVVQSGTDHEQSERPYALCHKRKWTASPAGLVW